MQSDHPEEDNVEGVILADKWLKTGFLMNVYICETPKDGNMSFD